jgi:hypothetical protein
MSLPVTKGSIRGSVKRLDPALGLPVFLAEGDTRMTGVIAETLEFETLSGKVTQMLNAFGSARSRRGLTADEVLIFLAAGQLSFMPEEAAQAAKPVTYIAISYLLNIPKETVRRKAQHLIELGLVESTSQGITVADTNSWRSFASALLKI